MTNATPESVGLGLRRLGYAFAIGFTILFGVFANSILELGWFPWLTDDWSELLPLINLSVVVSVVVYITYMFFDGWAWKTITSIITNAIAFWVGVRTLQVYPFEFGDTTIPWDLLARFIIGVVILGTAIAVIADAIRLLKGPDEESVDDM